MEKKDYWQIFKETGDPMCWLMYRASDDEVSETEPSARSEG